MSQGKGDTRRPSQIDRAAYEANWQRTFGKKEGPETWPLGLMDVLEAPTIFVGTLEELRQLNDADGAPHE